MRLQQNWSAEVVVKTAFNLLDSPATPERDRRFEELLESLHAAQLQALESALTASAADGNDWSAETALLWRCWAGLCPSSAEIYAATDPQRTRHLDQARSSVSAANEIDLLSDLTKP